MLNKIINDAKMQSSRHNANVLLAAVSVSYSNGRGKNGKQYAFVRPSAECFNRSRRVGGYDRQELNDAILKTVEKHFHPLNYYRVDGHVIGSNSEQGALAEYHRVCALSDVGKRFEVKQI